MSTENQINTQEPTKEENGKINEGEMVELQVEKTSEKSEEIVIKDEEKIDGVTNEEIEAPFSIEIITKKNGKFTMQVLRTDSLQEIRQYLLESIDTCCQTSYHLELDGVSVCDYVDFATVNAKEGSKFVVVEDSYDTTAARMHSRRLKEILATVPLALKKDSPSLSSCIVQSDSNKKTNVDEVNLSQYYPEMGEPIKCIKKLCYSGWNPVPGNRKLQGDLFYLDVVTIEGGSFCITSSTRGFFVNSTKQAFNPIPANPDHSHHDLVDVLRELSPKFKESFSQLLKYTFDSHPFELLPVPSPVIPWVVKNEKCVNDPSRVEDVIYGFAEVDHNIHGQTRDWNEELQHCRELKKETIQERISRDRALFKTHSDFVEAATKGAINVIDGNVPPINPVDDKKSHMFIYNNIFYSYAVDNRDFYKDVGGDITAYKQASNDLLGVLAYNKADIPGLYTLGTIIVDYRGYRLVAQTIIPGLFSALFAEDLNINIVYGSLEDNDFKVEEEFHNLLTQAAEKLNIKTHTITDKGGKSIKISTHADMKGILGSDERRYILDLYRTAPRDSNYSDPKHIAYILRPELMELYTLNLRKQSQKEKIDTIKKQEEERKKTETDSEKDKDFSEHILEELQKIAKEKFPVILYNSDVLTQHTLGDNTEEIKNDEDTIKQLSAYLKDTIIPSLVEDIVTYKINISDTQTISSVLHARGVNMRYLGHMAKLAKESKLKGGEYALNAFQFEMAARAVKSILNETLRNTKSENLAKTITSFLNALYVDSNTKENKKANQKDASFNLTHKQLWANVAKTILEKFNYQLQTPLPSYLFTFPFLRSICLKVGIQIAAKDYNLTSQRPFSEEDILQLFPVVKHAEPRSEDGHDLLEGGKTYMMQGRLDIAYDLLSESLAVFSQVYGPMQRDSAHCYSNLARVLLHLGETQQSIAYQQKAVVINERVLGLDHYETAHAYATLGLVVHQIKPSKSSLNCLKRSHFINLIAGGSNNYDNIGTYMNLGSIFQDLDEKEESRDAFTKALKLSEVMNGEMNLQTARLCHLLAVANSLVGCFSDALKYETRNHEICTKLVGPQDIKTMESNIWLGQLSSKAALESKSQQTNRKKRIEMAKQKKEAIETVQTVANALSQVDYSTLPIDDVLKWIGELEPKNARRMGPSRVVAPQRWRAANNQKPGQTQPAPTNENKKKKKKKNKKKKNNANANANANANTNANANANANTNANANANANVNTNTNAPKNTTEQQ